MASQLHEPPKGFLPLENLNLCRPGLGAGIGVEDGVLEVNLILRAAWRKSLHEVKDQLFSCVGLALAGPHVHPSLNIFGYRG